MELVDRYVHQVGRRLPKRLRGDVKTELRSLLLDTLEERTGLVGDETTFSEEDQVAVLEEFGPPAQMAAKYQPRPRYIIGPKVYTLYLIVVAALLGAGLLASTVTTVVGRFYTDSDGMNGLALLGQGLGIFLDIALNGIGSTTLIFAVLERVIPNREFGLDDDKEEWKPRDLPEIEERNEIKPAGLIVQIGILALLLIAFIGFPDRINMGAYYNDGWHIVPSLLSTEFFSLYLPLLKVSWSLTIILNLVLLRQGRWQMGTRIAELLIQGLDIFLLAWLLVGPSVLNAEALDKMFPIALQIPAPPIDGALRLAFVVALIVTIIETVVKIYRTWQVQTEATLPSLDAQNL
ncbi:MAG: hypothetical protein GY832_17760 [Chloroflexi bacterium]|nr:hypothetical protein [Chloroflexota bacterium]